VWQPTVMLIDPVVAPAGTVVVRLLVVAVVTVAVVPLNFTVLAVGGAEVLSLNSRALGH
jgi:hypothetical protein